MRLIWPFLAYTVFLTAASPPSPLDAINAARVRVGLPAMRPDIRLAHAAQLAAGDGSSHEAIFRRFAAARWPMTGRRPPGGGPGWPHNFSEDIGRGYSRTLGVAVGEWLADTAAMARTNPNEGHVRDFNAHWTHCGVGFNPRNGTIVVAYGYLP